MELSARPIVLFLIACQLFFAQCATKNSTVAVTTDPVVADKYEIGRAHV